MSATHGIAPRIASAAYYDRTHRAAARGASTITPQVVKDSLLASDLAQARSADRKIMEFILAIQVENRYRKPRILDKYLNSIYYGPATQAAPAAAPLHLYPPPPPAAPHRSPSPVPGATPGTRVSPHPGPTAPKPG